MNNPEQPSWTNKQGWQRGDDVDRELKRQQEEAAASKTAPKAETARKAENPWARGEQNERELGPLEVAKIRALVRASTGREGIAMYESKDAAGQKNQTAVILESATRGKTDSETASMLRERFRPEVSEEIDYFRELLGLKQEHPETFQLDGRGLIPGEFSQKYVKLDIKTLSSEELRALGEQVLGLLACAVPTAKPLKSGEAYSYRPDDLHVAAQWVSERYPEVSFEFSENPAKGAFSYVARLKQ